jgi:DNA-binding PadR family transcriptional regulator
VIQRPSYGYELVQRFERTYGDALELSSASQIYTALDVLEKRGLIELVPPEELGETVRQPKPHYRVTPQGMAGYTSWLVAHVADEQRRSRLFAHQIAVLPPREALAVIDRCERECLSAATAAPLAGEGGEGAARLAERLIDEEERLVIDARLAWVEYARRQLSAAAGAPAARPKRAR